VPLKIIGRDGFHLSEGREVRGNHKNAMLHFTEVLNRVPTLLLNIEKLYNKYTSFSRGRFACSRLIGWGQRYLGFKAPLLRLESGIVVEYSSAVAGDVLLRDLLLTGSFEPLHTEIIKKFLPVGGVFIDVGANVGYFSIIGANAVGPNGRVYAFEPMEEICRILSTNLSLNGLSNVEVKNLACFSSAGEMVMERDEDSGKSHLSPVKVENAKVVTLTTLDDFARDACLKRIDFIKVDAEGSDFEVLKGARWTIEKFRPAILVELDHLSLFGGSRSEVLKYFEDYHYQVSEIRGKHSLDLLCKPTPPPSPCVELADPRKGDVT
jgi:FkbM family methyltransferase